MTEDLRNRIDGMIKSMHLLRTESGTVEFDKLFNEVRELATTSEERREAGLYVREQMAMRRKRSDIDIKKIVREAQDVVSLSYIAKQYFNKDRSWLYQRINGTLVNGKPAAFTEQELTILANSLKNIGLKLSEISKSINQSL